MGSSLRSACAAAPLPTVQPTRWNYSNPQYPLVAVLGGVAAAVSIVLASTDHHASCMWNNNNETKYYEEEVRTPAAKKQWRKRGALDNTPCYSNRSGASAFGRMGETGLDMSSEAKADRSAQLINMNATLWEQRYVPESTEQLNSSLYALHRYAIAYVYVAICGIAAEEHWNGMNNVVQEIMVRLDMPDGSGGTVKKVLREYNAAVDGKVDYDKKKNYKERQKLQEYKINNDSLDMDIVVNYMALGLGMTQTSAKVNTNRKKCTPPP